MCSYLGQGVPCGQRQCHDAGGEPGPAEAGGGTQIGSRTFSIVGQAECARFSADRQVDVDWLFSDKRQLTDAKRAYAQFDQQTSSKGVLLF